MWSGETTKEVVRGLKIIVDENWGAVEDRLRLLGYDVERITDSRPDATLILDAIARRQHGESVAILTRDKGFVHQWEQYHRSFSACVVQTGGRNSRWPGLLARALQAIADTSTPTLAMIKSNKIRIVRQDGSTQG